MNFNVSVVLLFVFLVFVLNCGGSYDRAGALPVTTADSA